MRLGVPVYPAALVIVGRPCLVVGGGRVATRKIEGLLAAEAEVTVLAPEIEGRVESMPVKIVRRGYRRGDVAGYRLALTATGRREVDSLVFDDGERLGVLVNAADDPSCSSFHVPASMTRGPIQVAVSSGGSSPALSAYVRNRIGESIGPGYEHVAELVAGARAELRARAIPNEGLDWKLLIGGDRLSGRAGLVQLIESGRHDEAEALARSWVDAGANAGGGRVVGYLA